jgi:hypothetical protein
VPCAGGGSGPGRGPPAGPALLRAPDPARHSQEAVALQDQGVREEDLDREDPRHRPSPGAHAASRGRGHPPSGPALSFGGVGGKRIRGELGHGLVGGHAPRDTAGQRSAPGRSGPGARRRRAQLPGRHPGAHHHLRHHLGGLGPALRHRPLRGQKRRKTAEVVRRALGALAQRSAGRGLGPDRHLPGRAQPPPLPRHPGG